MNKCEQFLNFFDYLLEQSNISRDAIPREITEYYEILRTQQGIAKEKPLLTETGAEILRYLQTNNIQNGKAKEIADGMGVPSKKISGSMRKLVTDGFVEKIGANPVVYALTDKGKNFNIQDYKENYR